MRGKQRGGLRVLLLRLRHRLWLRSVHQTRRSQEAEGQRIARIILVNLAKQAAVAGLVQRMEVESAVLGAMEHGAQ
jgi:predicted RNA binding protein with dsRBD fold (UPF0201 family)